MKNNNFGIISANQLLTRDLLFFLNKLGKKPKFIIKINKGKNVFRRSIFRLKKYGFFPTLIWLTESIRLRFIYSSKPNVTSFSSDIDIFSMQDISIAMKKYKPKFIINASSEFIPKSVIKVPEYGIISVHPGILPYYSGLQSLHWQVVDGKIPGFSIFQLSEVLDSGPIFLNKYLKPKRKESFTSYRRRFFSTGGLYLSLISYLILRDNYIFRFKKIVDKKVLNRGLKTRKSISIFKINWNILTNAKI